MDHIIITYILIAVFTTGANLIRLNDLKSWYTPTPEEIRHLSRCVLLSPVWPVLLVYVFYRVYKEAI